MVTRYEVKTDTDEVYSIDAVDADAAARRIADLHQVTVVATRESRQPTIRVGFDTDGSA